MKDVQIKAEAIEVLLTIEVLPMTIVGERGYVISAPTPFAIASVLTVLSIGGNSLNAIPAPNTFEKERILACA